MAVPPLTLQGARWRAGRGARPRAALTQARLAAVEPRATPDPLSRAAAAGPQPAAAQQPGSHTTSRGDPAQARLLPGPAPTRHQCIHNYNKKGGS